MPQKSSGQHHASAHAHGPQVHHGSHAHASHPHKKRLRLFHPRKLWVFLAVIALTLGMALGEARFSGPSSEALMPAKISHNMQVASFSFFDGTKQGAQRLPYLVSMLTSKDANPLEDQPPSKSGIKRVCFWEDQLAEGEAPRYSAEIVEVKMSQAVTGGEEFRVEIYLTNTGNTFWFGLNSGCADKTMVNLGTLKPVDRASVFFHEGEQTGWVGNNRVQLVEDVVKPGDTGTFAFTAIAPKTNTIYREYFGLVAEETTWFDGFEVPVDVRVGQVTPDEEAKLAFIRDLSTDTARLTGEHTVEVDLSDQKMFLKIGGETVYRMTVSTGASDTPTPKGTYKIMSKQELRVGSKAPHYRMPYFQQFTSMGHGLHALPYLGSTTGGWFWQEALTHIGIPVSHGCIRVLPDDALLVYQFTEVGTTLTIYQ